MIILITVLSLYPENDIKYHIGIDSYIGADYYPERIEKKYSYFDELYFRLGGSVPVLEKSRFFLDVINKGDFNGQVPRIDKFIYVQDFRLLNLTLGYDFVETGFGSEIYRISVKDPYFDSPFFADYNYTGIKLECLLPRFYLKTLLGGNQFNSTVFQFTVNYIRQSWNINGYYLFTGRSNEQNLKTNAWGEELEIETETIRIYQATHLALTEEVQQYNWHSQDIVKLFLEFILRFHPDFRAGSNCLCQYVFTPEEEITWQYQYFLGFDIGKFTFIPQYHHYQTRDFINREFEIILEINIDPVTSIGIDGSYYHPSLGQDHYQAGFQVKFHYEKN